MDAPMDAIAHGLFRVVGTLADFFQPITLGLCEAGDPLLL